MNITSCSWVCNLLVSLHEWPLVGEIWTPEGFIFCSSRAIQGRKRSWEALKELSVLRWRNAWNPLAHRTAKPVPIDTLKHMREHSPKCFYFHCGCGQKKAGDISRGPTVFMCALLFLSCAWFYREAKETRAFLGFLDQLVTAARKVTGWGDKCHAF